MENKNINVRENIGLDDLLTSGGPERGYVGKDGKFHRGFRTSITGVDDFGQVLFEEEQNTMVLGGAIEVLQSLFQVQSTLQVASLNKILGIANDGPEPTPAQKAGRKICLFGVGTSGAGDVIGSVKDVDYREREIGEMIPFRVTDQQLAVGDVGKYWFRKVQPNGKTAYNLKSFDGEPVIKNLWADGEGDEDGTTVEDNPQDSPKRVPIDTFIEIKLTITSKDLREHFTDKGNVESARFNSIALCVGTLGEVADGTPDYKDVKVFSKFNFNNEPLDLPKNITFYYRIYMS